MKHISHRNDGYIQIVVISILVLLVAAVVVFFVSRKHNPAPTTTGQATLSTYCVGQTFESGSSGHCVRDIQTLVNYMEHSGLTECPFNSGATLTVNGTYDSTTAAQVKSVQEWSGCYATQEGFTSNVPQTGTVDKATWGELCTYGYTDPLHTSAAGASSSIAAGKDAGCAQSQS